MKCEGSSATQVVKCHRVNERKKRSVACLLFSSERRKCKKYIYIETLGILLIEGWQTKDHSMMSKSI
jgi:hypothetical protein